ncbi:MAG: hypothetical protein RR951_02340 [Ruthenibacterium sp.]
MWRTPKTNWQRTDTVQAADWQRICENLLALWEQAQAVLYPPQASAAMPQVTSDSACTQSLLNTVEDNTARLAACTFDPGVPPAHRWQPNEASPAAQDLNRLESSAAALRAMLTAQQDALSQLEFLLGGTSF